MPWWRREKVKNHGIALDGWKAWETSLFRGHVVVQVKVSQRIKRRNLGQGGLGSLLAQERRKALDPADGLLGLILGSAHH